MISDDYIDGRSDHTGHYSPPRLSIRMPVEPNNIDINSEIYNMFLQNMTANIVADADDSAEEDDLNEILSSRALRRDSFRRVPR